MNILKESQKIEIFIVTDMQQDKAKTLLTKNHFTFDDNHILCADWSELESRCKEVICRRYKMDVLFDDHMPYLTSLSKTLGMLVMPKKDSPYNSREWHAEKEETNDE